jgi:DNA polymerase-1
VVKALAPLFTLPVCFVGHNLKVELFCLWSLNLEEMTTVWDTYIAEKAFALGRNYHGSKVTNVMDEFERSDIKKSCNQQNETALTLVATAHRYGIVHQNTGNKHALQSSFLEFEIDGEFTQEQVEYAAEDAIVAAKLYLHQLQAAANLGVLQHLVTVEMPWVFTTAQMEWNGVKVDATKRVQVVTKAQQFTNNLQQPLKNAGLHSVNSNKQLEAFFGQHNLLRFFPKKKNSYIFDKTRLKDAAIHSPLIKLIQQARKAATFLSDKILLSELESKVDSRIHTKYQQLGAATGRQTCSTPNLLGISSTLRPLIVPENGFGIGEVDLSQIEPGIAGAIFHNQQLIDMFNTGDIYSEMAKVFFAKQLSDDVLNMPYAEFKKQYPQYRQQMKVCTLGIIYGLSNVGLAAKLGIEEAEAAEKMAAFMQLFPGLSQTLNQTVCDGIKRRFSQTNTGLKRFLDKNVVVGNSERNWLKNHPVQGSAACVFKIAGNRLHRLYKQYDAKLLIALHDSFVFEAPLEQLAEIANMTAMVMQQAVVESFPVLKPRTDINIRHPQCWNKDGAFDSIEKWSVGEIIEVF